MNYKIEETIDTETNTNIFLIYDNKNKIMARTTNKNTADKIKNIFENDLKNTSIINLKVK